jgi:putative transposase
VEGFLVERFGLSHRRSCGLVGLWRATFQYRPKPRDEAGLIQRLKELAQARPRFGYRRLHVMLRREGFKLNHKRTERIYRREGLSLRVRKRKKRASGVRVPLPAATRSNERWAMDFMEDKLMNGRKFRAFTLEDAFSRESPAIEADHSLTGQRVCRVLDHVAGVRGLPEVIQIDNGPEFAGKALDAWAYQRGVKLEFISPGKPTENGHIESFNGHFRDECLKMHWFASLQEAREVIEAWRVDYNRVRPHSSLGYLTPEEFAAKHAAVTMKPTQRLSISMA